MNLKADSRRLGVIIAAVLSAYNLLNNSQYYLETSYLSIVVSFIATFVYVLVSWFVISYVLNYFEHGHKRLNYIYGIIILLASTTALLGVFYYIGTQVRTEIHSLLPRRENVQLYILFRGVASLFFIFVIQIALRLHEKSQKVAFQNQQLQTENMRVRFEVLRQHVNPHFLFNSLSTLRSMIHTNDAHAEDFAIKLSEIYRQLLLKKEKDLIPLSEELDFLADYQYMLLARFEGKLIMNIEIPPSLLHFLIPTFSLQLLLENCIKHNIISQEKPLTISIFNTRDDSLIIENNYQTKKTVEPASGTGLQNLEMRFTLLGIQQGIQVFSDENVFRVKLKLIDPQLL